MKKFTYPAVLYYDKDNNTYLMYIEELGISGLGQTMEECNADLYGALEQYILTAMQFDIDIPEPQSYDIVFANNPKNTILLVTLNFDERKIKKLG